MLLGYTEILLLEKIKEIARNHPDSCNQTGDFTLFINPMDLLRTNFPNYSHDEIYRALASLRNHHNNTFPCEFSFTHRYSNELMIINEIKLRL